VDSDDPHRHFSNEEVSLVETMAGQLAGAIDNLRSFENTQRRANREALINEITAKIQGTVTVDSALQTTIQELGKALKARKTRVALGLTPTEPETNGHTTPN
jgi:GAF domain-containing protein